MKTLTFRVSPAIVRRVYDVAELYGALPTVFLREMVEAICAGDQAKTIAFLSRVQEGITKQTQLDLFAQARAEARKAAQEGQSRSRRGKGAAPP